MTKPSTQPITTLAAEDDADDRLLVKGVFHKSRVTNGIIFTKDGLELLD